MAVFGTMPAQNKLPRYLKPESEHHRLSSDAQSYGTRAYAFYAIAAAISLPFVWLTVCETKGKTLEQMKDTTELETRTAQ